MKRSFITLSVFWIFFFYSSLSFSFEGPVSYRNQFPLFSHLNTPVYESAIPESSLGVSLTHSSIHSISSSRHWNVSLDMEITELTFSFKKILYDSFQLALELPVRSYSSGFLDDFINSYHDFFGFPDYGRSKRPNNQFLYEVRRDGKLIVKGKNGEIGLSDLRLSVKKAILANDPALSIKVDLELPTGDADRGFGNGSVDWGVSLLFSKRLSSIFQTHGAVGIIFTGDLNAHEDVDMSEYLHGVAGIEFKVLKSVSLLAYLSFMESPFPETSISSVDRTAVLLALGGSYHFKTVTLQLSFIEDLSTSGAPDFSINLALIKSKR